MVCLDASGRSSTASVPELPPLELPSLPLKPLSQPLVLLFGLGLQISRCKVTTEVVEIGIGQHIYTNVRQTCPICLKNGD